MEKGDEKNKICRMNRRRKNRNKEEKKKFKMNHVYYRYIEQQEEYFKLLKINLLYSNGSNVVSSHASADINIT